MMKDQQAGLLKYGDYCNRCDQWDQNTRAKAWAERLTHSELEYLFEVFDDVLNDHEKFVLIARRSEMTLAQVAEAMPKKLDEDLVLMARMNAPKAHLSRERVRRIEEEATRKLYRCVDRVPLATPLLREPKMKRQS